MPTDAHVGSLLQIRLVITVLTSDCIFARNSFIWSSKSYLLLLFCGCLYEITGFMPTCSVTVSRDTNFS